MSTKSPKIEVINGDLRSKEGWVRFLEGRAECAREMSKRKDPKFADAALVLTRDVMTGEPFEKLTLMICAVTFHSKTDDQDEIEEQKNAFVTMMFSAGIAGGAIASVWRSETWMSQNTSGIRPKNDPKRTEQIILMHDHCEFGKGMWAAEIAAHPTKRWKRKIRPWVRLDDIEGGVTMGRFSSFVPPRDAVLDEELVGEAREYIKYKNTLREVFRHDPGKAGTA